MVVIGLMVVAGREGAIALAPEGESGRCAAELRLVPAFAIRCTARPGEAIARSFEKAFPGLVGVSCPKVPGYARSARYLLTRGEWPDMPGSNAYHPTGRRHRSSGERPCNPFLSNYRERFGLERRSVSNAERIG